MNFVVNLIDASKFGWFWGIIPIIIVLLSLVIIITVIDIMVKGSRLVKVSVVAGAVFVTLIIISLIPTGYLSPFFSYLLSALMSSPAYA